MSQSLVKRDPGFRLIKPEEKQNPIEFIISWKQNYRPDSWQMLGRFVIDFNSDHEKHKLRLIQHLLYSKGIEFNQAAIKVDGKPSMEERQFSDAQRFKRKLTYLMNRYQSDVEDISKKNMFDDIKQNLLKSKFEELRQALQKAYDIYGVTLEDVDHDIKTLISHQQVNE